MFSEEFHDERPVITKRLPNGNAPLMNHSIALRSCRRSDHLADSDSASSLWKRKDWPRLLVTREFHMCQLDLLAGKVFLDVQVEADQRKGQFDRLVTFGDGLRAKGIDDVLMNKRRIAVRERVITQLIVSVMIYIHRCRD